jgi:hypothetical protein
MSSVNNPVAKRSLASVEMTDIENPGSPVSGPVKVRAAVSTRREPPYVLVLVVLLLLMVSCRNYLTCFSDVFENKQAFVNVGLIAETHKETGALLDSTSALEAASAEPLLREPPLPGIAPGLHRPHVILAQDIDYPPYAYLGSATEEFDVDGFGHDIAKSLEEVCDIDVTVVETR